MIGLMLLGLSEAVIRPEPVFHFEKRADVAVGGGSGNVPAAKTVKVIGLPLISSALSGSNISFNLALVAPSRPLWKLPWNIRK